MNRNKHGLITELGHSSSRKAYVLMQKGKDIVNKYKDFLKDFGVIPH